MIPAHIRYGNSDDILNDREETPMTETFPRVESAEFRGMGTDLAVLIIVNNEEEVNKASTDIAVAKGFYTHYEKIFSRFDRESELCRINASLGQYLSASEAMRQVAASAIAYHERYSGLYDPRIITALEAAGYARDFQKKDFTPLPQTSSFDPSIPLTEDILISGEQILFKKRMDFSGIVKGYVTDRVAEFLSSQGWKNFLVDSGGDIFAAGKPHDASAWNITVEGVDDASLTLALSDIAVATSGVSRRQWTRGENRYHHLVHPRHPDRFLFDITTVSVIAPTTESADVLAKVLFIEDATARQSFIIQHHIAAILFSAEKDTWVSPAAQHFLISTHQEENR